VLLGLETIFYCLRFETSLFVDSYYSHGHGGGIRPRLHTGLFSGASGLVLYSSGTDNAENTVLLQTTQKRNHVIAKNFAM
jgi:hypothetical protein